MSSSSYLGHGAKYWADRYFELQTKTRTPDDFSNLEWRDKYLNLEKSCALYQSQIADLRTEVADLREKASLNPEPELYEGHTAEYWFSETKKVYGFYYQVLDELKEKEDKYDSVLDQLNDLEANLSAVSYEGHDIVYWYTCAQKSRISAEALRSALKKLDASSVLDGHDINYWHELSIAHAHDLAILKHENDRFHQKNYNRHQKAGKSLSIKVIIISAIFLLLSFLAGLLLGEGYFAPQFVPSSPYIQRLQRSIISEKAASYWDGYSVGLQRGRERSNP